MAGIGPAMTRINSGHFFQTHCHLKRREIKPEQLRRSARQLRAGDAIELFQPLLHRLAQVIAVAAERGVASADEVALLPGQCQGLAMAGGLRAGDRLQEDIVDVAVELLKLGRFFELATSPSRSTSSAIVLWLSAAV